VRSSSCMSEVELRFSLRAGMLGAWGALTDIFNTGLTLEFAYCLDGKKTILTSISDDTSILAYEKARSDKQYLAG
jgi:hypothetical protein